MLVRIYLSKLFSELAIPLIFKKGDTSMKQQGAFSMDYLDFAERSFESLKDYGYFVEHNIKQKVEKYEELTRNHNAGDFLKRGKEQYSIDFLNIMQSAWLMSIYALTEPILTNLCDAHAEIKGAKKLKRNSEDGRIIEIKTYLQKQDPEHFSVLEYENRVTLNCFESPDYPSQPTIEYEKILDFLDAARLIRNKFAHAEGVADDTVKDKIKNCDEVTIQSDNRIILSEKYCYKLLENIQHLLNGLRLWVYGVVV